MAAFVGTNVDNCVVTTAMVAAAPLERAHRIAAGQVVGFSFVVVVAAVAALLLFEFSAAAVGLLGFVPLAIGARGLIGLRHRRPGRATGAESAPRGRRPATERAVGRSLIAAGLVTIAAGGDNLAVYIPLFHEGGVANLLTIAIVFVAGEVALTMLVLTAGRHPRARGTMTKLGAVAVPLLLCVVGVLVLLSAGTLSWL
ncbi:MAG TPA: cadmium resistance transporter [Acidimicrobiales bacterium]|nr:cadmium resistance transporter [Acidimicrobiales bacterium]